MRLPRVLRPPRALRRPARWGALTAGAVLAVLIFPAPDLSVLAWFTLVPGLMVIRNAPSAREAGVRGWWLASGYIMAAMYWLAPEIGPGLLLVAVLLGVLLVPFAVAAWALLRPPLTTRRALAALVVVPSCWLLGEWLRSWQALGGPWAVLGASQWQHPAVLALASVGGVWLVSWVLVAANVAITIVLVSARWTARAAAALVAAAGVAAGPAVFALTAPAPASRTATIALVQPGVVNNDKLRVDASQRLTTDARRGPGPISSSGVRAASPTTWKATPPCSVPSSGSRPSRRPRSWSTRIRSTTGPSPRSRCWSVRTASPAPTPRPGWSRSASTSRSAARCPG